MTRLFLSFYVGVLVVLFLAWYLHGVVLKQRSDADLARVIVAAHGGGARIVAEEINAADPQEQTEVLNRLQARFRYPLQVLPRRKLPDAVRRQLVGGQDVAHQRLGRGHAIVAALRPAERVVRLGPFPEYDLQEIEESLDGWMRLTADRIDAAVPARRAEVLAELRKQFSLPLKIVPRQQLNEWPRSALERGKRVVFYAPNLADGGPWFATTPLANGTDALRFGPFPSFAEVEQNAAATTLALVLLPAALAIALLLRPVAQQLRHVEKAAKAIAAGDLSARVDEQRLRAAQPLAAAFNHMAQQTENMLRTQRELLQAVSHELRTPLARMQFAIQLIDEATDPQERKRRLESLHAATEELNELVGELLRYVRMETAEPQLKREVLSLGEALDSAIPKYAALYPSLQFSHDSDQSKTCELFVDRVGFQRALGNLLSNAGRFAQSQIVLSAHTENGWTTIDVDDDGCGIAEADRERVLEPFVRLASEPNENGHGVGLGLALVHRIVTQHGGRAEILDSPCGGCRVRTRWPAERL